jgi:glycosyltransferase involved in cell wall biosynthesis
MRIALDGRVLNTPHMRGMGKATFELLREGTRAADVSFIILGDEPRSPVHYPPSDRISFHTWEVRGHRFRAWEQVGLPSRARQLGCDVLHCLGTWGPYWQPLPTVITIHDTLPWEEERPSWFLTHVLPAAYARASALITISEKSRHDILARWPRLADKLVVIPHGVSDRYLVPDIAPLPESLTALGVRPPYLLYFGGEIPRKRLEWAIAVWHELGRADVQLVLCGLATPKQTPWRDPLPAHLRELVIPLEFVSEPDLPSLYAHAEAVLYPTLYEGFGFPALESQAAGVPVLMSAVGSLRELIGPGAIVLPVDDFQAWVAACRRVLEGDKPDAAAARQWAKRFSWGRTFEQTLEVYQRALTVAS